MLIVEVKELLLWKGVVVCVRGVANVCCYREAFFESLLVYRCSDAERDGSLLVVQCYG